MVEEIGQGQLIIVEISQAPGRISEADQLTVVKLGEFERFRPVGSTRWSRRVGIADNCTHFGGEDDLCAVDGV